MGSHFLPFRQEAPQRCFFLQSFASAWGQPQPFSQTVHPSCSRMICFPLKSASATFSCAEESMSVTVGRETFICFATSSWLRCSRSCRRRDSNSSNVKRTDSHTGLLVGANWRNLGSAQMIRGFLVLAILLSPFPFWHYYSILTDICQELFWKKLKKFFMDLQGVRTWHFSSFRVKF